MQVLFAVIATLAAGAFSVAVLRQWGRRHRPYQMAWGISLTMFTVASLMLTIGVAEGWSSPVYRLYFLFGALLNVPWLALGTVLLGGRRRLIRSYFAVLIAFTVTSVVLVSTMGVPAAVFVGPGRVPIDKQLPTLAQVLAASSGSIGTLIVVIGAIASALAIRSRPQLRTRMQGNLLITLGVLAAASGGLLIFLGNAASLSAALAVGVTIMFLGFRRASLPTPIVPSAPAPVEPAAHLHS